MSVTRSNLDVGDVQREIRNSDPGGEMYQTQPGSAPPCQAFEVPTLQLLPLPAEPAPHS